MNGFHSHINVTTKRVSVSMATVKVSATEAKWFELVCPPPVGILKLDIFISIFIYRYFHGS